MLELQREIHARVARGDDPDTWLVVEHEPVITLGRNAKSENVLLRPASLAARGIEVVHIERGGDATYHGPGQLIIYPIVKLARFREVVPFVSTIETAVQQTLATLEIAAERRREHRGVYVGNDGICAIGLAVKQMTTLHGLSLNVFLPVEYNLLIVPCGTPGYGITSVSRQLGRKVSLDEARQPLLAQIERLFKISFVNDGSTEAARVRANS